MLLLCITQIPSMHHLKATVRRWMYFELALGFKSPTNTHQTNTIHVALGTTTTQTKMLPPPLSKVRLGEKKVRGVCLGQGRAVDKGRGVQSLCDSTVTIDL